MKSETQLDSVVFQLTPTRTRCDLVINVNGKTEKVASGLLNPFLAQLKIAQDQIAKGGYSIMLEPNGGRDATWFTKATVERFVRFVSTPEVLERVNTIESEILQIVEAISIQSNNNLGLSTVEERQMRSTEIIEGSKPVLDSKAEKAIVLYTPEAHPPESIGSTTQGENSKVQLLRVLETRKTVLQKEQAMAFARAVAAGFDVDNMAPLISFAECFGASRLMEACLRFIDLWKGKHETGQWLEIDSAEAMSSRSDFSMNASGIMFSSEIKEQKESREAWPVSHVELGTESNGKASNDASADLGSDFNRDVRPAMESQVPLGHHEYFQGQFQPPMYPQWPIHPPPGAPPFFQAYPVQGMPYYHNYPAYPPIEDPRFNTAQSRKQRRHSMDSRYSNTESETWEVGDPNARSQDSSEFEKEGSRGQESRRKSGWPGKKKSGKVVIQNINYITSKRRNTSGSESQSASDPETDEEVELSLTNSKDLKDKKSSMSSKSTGNHKKTSDSWEHNNDGQEADGGNWQTFQNFLLKDDNENARTDDQGMFSMEKDAQVKRKQNTTGVEPVVPLRGDVSQVQDRGITEFDSINGMGIHKFKASNEELVIPRGEFQTGGLSSDDPLNVQFSELEGGRGGYKRAINDDVMIYGQRNQSAFANSLSDLVSGNGFGHKVDTLDRNSTHNIKDESFIVPLRGSSQDQVGPNSSKAIDMDSEFPAALQKSEDSSNRIRSQLSYEPDDLNLMPEREIERESIGYNPAIDYEMQVHIEDAIAEESMKKDNVIGDREGSKKLENDKKLKAVQGSLDKRKMEGTIKKGKISKLSPLSEAQARAEKLRAFKAELQKVKKEKEEEELKRLEALKRERQKRIAAKVSSSPAQSSLSSQQARPRVPTKLSTSSLKGSKFSDSEPGPLSPLQRLPIRTDSMGSNVSPKTSKSSKLSNGGHLTGNGLSRSVSSLPELKKERNVKPEPKATTERIRRLSEPKTNYSHHVSSMKVRDADQVSKPKLSDGPEIKKISAIMSLDRTKAATLPELKIKKAKGPSEVVQKKSTTKEMQKVNGNRSSVTPESINLKKNSEKMSGHSNGDENPVVEKTVLMLEHEIPPPAVQITEERKEKENESYDEHKSGVGTQLFSEYTPIHAPASPLTVFEVNQAVAYQLEDQPSSHEVRTDNAMEKSPKFSSISVTEKPYQAPYARASSLEDQYNVNLEYIKAPPTNSEVAITNIETSTARIPEFTDLNSLEKTPNSEEKPSVKESSKGFRRYLKFGRKKHSSTAGEHNVQSDKLSVDGSVAGDHAAISNEAPMLKNLISQDETPKGGSIQKASRPFSLLSPFRSKTSEKRLST